MDSDTATAVLSVAAAAATLPALRFARGSRGSGVDCLRVRCVGGDLPSAAIMQIGVEKEVNSK